MSLAIESETATDRWTPLPGVGWEGFQHAKALVAESGVRITYANGDLLLMSPGVHHEAYSEAFSDLFRAVASGLRIPIRPLGSMLWERIQADAGKMPDEAFYISHAAQVEGRMVDDEADPLPDLVVEIEISHPPKLALRAYAQMGVPEVWHFRQRPGRPAALRFLQLVEGQWVEVDESPALPMLHRAKVLDMVMRAAVLSLPDRTDLLDRWVRDELRPRRRPRRPKGDTA